MLCYNGVDMLPSRLARILKRLVKTRQGGEKKPRIDAEKQDLQNRIERRQRGDILIVPLCQLAQHDDHRNAARNLNLFFRLLIAKA